MPLTKETKVIEAHHPRQNEFSTLRPDDRLRLAYNVLTDSTKTKSVPAEERIVLYFVHGNGMSKECWEYNANLLFEKHGDVIEKMIAIDIVNQNDSYQLNKDKLGWLPQWGDGGRDVVKIVKAETGPGINILVGHSMGGVQCMYASLFEPALIDSLVTVDPVVFAEHGWESDEQVQKYLQKRFHKIHRLLRTEFKDKADYEKYIREGSMSRTWHPDIQTSYMNGSGIFHSDGTVTFKTSALQQMSTYYATIYSFRHGLKLASLVDHEVLHIAGTQDSVTKRANAVECRKVLQHGVSVDIDGAGHLVPFEKPHETVDAIAAFISRRRTRRLEIRSEYDSRKSFSPAQLDAMFKERFDEIENTYPNNRLYSRL